MHYLLNPLGSAGDVHPFIALGLRLKQRGHTVSVLTSPYFQPLCEQHGLRFLPLGTREEFLAGIQNPDLWKPQRAFAVVSELVERGLPLAYETIAAEVAQQPTVVVAGSLGLAARVAHDKLGVPLVTVHLQPSVFRSAHEPPHLPGLGLMHWLPRPGRRALFRAIDALIIDRWLGRPLNRFRASLGLPPVARFMDAWWHSPQLVLGLFPDWYAAPQTDWPPQLRLVGFPLYDESDVQPVLPPALAEFLAEGSAPIVVAPGSANAFGRAIFEPVVAACRRSGRRALLLTRFPDQVPTRLPAGVRHVDYVPFSLVLPRAALLVHHGGIGTTAQALAAGVPQLIRPMAHDQFDNAARVRRLGVGTSLAPRRFTGRQVAGTIERLLADDGLAQRCRAIAPQLRQVDPLALACEAIEQLPAHASGALA